MPTVAVGSDLRASVSLGGTIHSTLATMLSEGFEKPGFQIEIHVNSKDKRVRDIQGKDHSLL